MPTPPGPPPPPVSPWVREFADYQGAGISISIDFNPTTLALLGGTVHRDPGCVYTSIMLGIDSATGAPARSFDVPEGDTNLSFQMLRRAGYTTYDQLTSVQITAGA